VLLGGLIGLHSTLELDTRPGLPPVGLKRVVEGDQHPHLGMGQNVRVTTLDLQLWHQI